MRTPKSFTNSASAAAIGCRLERIHRFADARVERQAGVRDHRERKRRVLGQIAHRLAHVLRARRAVEPDDVDAERLERRHRAGDVGAEQHAAADVERDLRLHRNAAAELREEPLEAGDGRLHLEDVLRRLDEQDVDAALDKVLAPGRGNSRASSSNVMLPRAPGRCSTGACPSGPSSRRRTAGLSGVAYLSARRARESRGGDVDVADLVAEPPFLEPARRRLEGARLDDVAPDREERLVDRLDDVGAGEDEVVVAAFERLPAEILGREVEALDARAHRAVVDEDALVRAARGRVNRLADVPCVLPDTKKARAWAPGGSALADCLTWPQVALNRHGIPSVSLHIVAAENGPDK